MALQQGKDDDAAVLLEVRAMLESWKSVDPGSPEEMLAERLRMRQHGMRLAALRGGLHRDRDFAIELRLNELTKRVERLEARE